MEIPFTRPDITAREVDAVSAVLRSGWLTTGPITARFENALCDHTGADGVVCVASATAGLELTLRLLGIGPGDEVIVPAYTFTATAAAVVHVGATPIPADCLPGCFHLRPEAVEPLMSPRTAAVIGVDLAGELCDYDGLKAICADFCAPKRGGLWELLGRPAVLADAAHSLGAEGSLGHSGTLADFTVFSFHAAKNLTTAEGGAIAWHIPGASGLPAAELRRMSLHGQDRDALVRRGGVSVEYDIVTLGYKANMTDLQAAVGLSQLLRYRAMISQRRFLTKRYEAGLPNGWSCLAHTPGWSAHLMMALMPEQAASRRNALFAQLLRQGIHANIHYRPLPLMTVYRRMGWREDNCPNAIALYEREVSLPLSSVMTVQEADFVLDCLHQFSEATGPF